MSDNADESNRRLQQLRLSAEAQLARAEPTKAPSPFADELLHELGVHQIELEMQNEELRLASVALETSRAHYVELYDFAPVGYLTLTPEGMIAEINLTGAKLLGVERKKILQRRFVQFIADDYKDHWHRHYLRVKQQGGKQTCELSLRRADGTSLYALLDCLYLRVDDTDPVLRITLADITERKLAEEALRIAAAAFETQDGIIVTDTHKVILRVNQAFSRITGYSTEEAINRVPGFLLSGWHHAEFYRALWATVTRNGYWQGEIWEKRKNGEVFPAWQTITAVTGADGIVSHYVGSFTDITVQKQAEKILFVARESLENTMATTKDELEKNKEDTAEINATLNVLLKRRATDKSDAQIALSQEIETTIVPFIKKLKGSSTDRLQTTRLIGILEANLKQLVKAYGNAANLPTAYQQLTPVEIQVASMIRQGLSTKIIAATLKSSPETISIHRKHIRKKLGLDSKASNLHSYLLSLTE